ncbi:hypothetical protein GIW74_12055 [Pseudomonas syringae]|nr:hypothetical protein [Pseudomonas syringae]
MSGIPPRADDGLHTKQIRTSIPAWIAHSTLTDIQSLKRALFPGHSPSAPLPHWQTSASPQLQSALSTSQTRSRTSRELLAKTLETLKGVSAFTEPLLVEALKKRLGKTLDVNKNALFYLRYRMATERHTLLQAALLNFEGNEDFSQTQLGETSALAPIDALITEYGEFDHVVGGSPATYRYTEKLPLSPQDFSQLCRTLDLGRQYQEHLKQVFEAPDRAAVVRSQMIAAQKDLLEVRVHTARMKNEITESFYRALLAVLSGTPYATLEGKPLAYSRLSIFGMPLGEVVLIGPGFKPKGRTAFDWVYPIPGVLDLLIPKMPVGRFVVWIPGAPLYPLKEYDSIAQFNQDLAINLRAPSYQKLFASLLPQNKAADFLQRLEARLYTYKWNNQGLRERVYDENIDLNLRDTPVTDEPFGALYDLHVQRLKDNALAVAVPTAEADRQAAKERLDYWLSIGMNALNVAAFVVPGVGELMMAVTAVQLGMEVYHGIESWQQGDMEAALGHLESVALNVAFMAGLGGGGGMAGKAPLIQGSQWGDGVGAGKLPSGGGRLWEPDLVADRGKGGVPPSGQPHARGQYEVNGKIYVRIGDGVYEKGFDTHLKKWRIKHPTNDGAYQPILQENRGGAWREIHERPLEWDRLTLLRRIGHETEGLSDETLTTLGEISGVSDDALRQMHVDGLPVPSLLAETLRQFRLDDEVGSVIAQIRRGTGLDWRYEYALPLVVEMPRWPAGRILEVFNGPELWGSSREYGTRTSAADVRATIKITRREVLQGKLPQRVLADLDEQETIDLLGRQAQGVDVAREPIFNARLADHAQKSSTQIYQSLQRSSDAVVEHSEWLRRRFPRLSSEGVREVMGNASPSELARISEGGEVPARLDDLARTYLQQSRLNRAMAGLHRDNLASFDSDRLALHTLERLPGWPTNLRLELHAERFEGRVLDSIGSETAPQRKYLVRAGERFQAYDEQGVPLNGVPLHGRNLYESIMHALPDSARSGLGLPQVNQHEELQRLLARYASTHRTEMADFLKLRLPRSRPALSRVYGRPGFALSGDGKGLVAHGSLTARVRDVYPNLTDTEADTFIFSRLGQGDTEQQIVHFLNVRQREFQVLKAALDEWAEVYPPGIAGLRESRERVARTLINCWRNRIFTDAPALYTVDLTGVGDLPALVADFSDVRMLRVDANMILGEPGAALLRQFPRAKRLSLNLDQSTLAPVIERLGGLRSVTDVILTGEGLVFMPAVLQRLNTLEHLQMLSLRGAMLTLDVSGLRNLRALSVSGTLATWPSGVFELEHLAFLNLKGTRINALPETLFAGHSRLWRRLQLDWSAFEPRVALRAFEYLLDNPAHPVDVEQWVAGYGETVLNREVPEPGDFGRRVMSGFRRQGLSLRDRMTRIETLVEERRTLMQKLQEWQATPLQVGRESISAFTRERCATSLINCWRAGLEGRYLAPGEGLSVSQGIGELDLSTGALGVLPELPDGLFNHVRRLNLHGVNASPEGFDGFLRQFPEVRHLKLSSNNLTALPSSLADLRPTHLDLSFNHLTITAEIQETLGSLTTLEELNLQGNRVEQLQISKLVHLSTLRLSGTALKAWPEGALELPRLQLLDLSRSAVTTIPEAAWHGHDALLQGTNVRGCRLTPPTLQAVSAYGQRARLDQPLGIPMPLLAEGRTGGDPEFFPENVSDNPKILIVVPEQTGSVEALTPAAFLQRLDPTMSDTMAGGHIQILELEGLSTAQIEERLTEWSLHKERLINTLNDWIDVPAYREGTRWVSAWDRRRAAEKIVEVWRGHAYRRYLSSTLTNDKHLNLVGLCTGDLPTLPKQFDHVTELTLSEVRMTAQGSNDFLRGFPNLRELTLDNNGLTSLPQPLTELTAIIRISAAQNGLTDGAEVARQLRALPALKHVNLRWNNLDSFDVSGMDLLESLDLSHNALNQWPAAVLDAPHLRSLNLSLNRISEIPERALTPACSELMEGTELSDNPLTRLTFARLSVYLDETGEGLGYTQHDINVDLGESSEEFDASTTSEESDGENQDADVHPENLTPQQQKDQWFSGVDAHSEKHLVWDALKEAENNSYFFYNLAQLRHARDFKDDLAELTQRVWTVLDAADQDAGLRDRLFTHARASRTNATCGDGWMLLFSELETMVYEAKVLTSVAIGSAEEGRSLLKLARGMIRLDEVEAEARKAIALRPNTDPAEVRFAYRIKLAKRLELPRQPVDMLYEPVANVSDADIKRAYDRIIEEENTTAFLQKLATRDYWVSYLERTYPDDFSELSRQKEVEVTALEALYPELNDAYGEAYEKLHKKYQAESLQLLIRLSGQQRSSLGV